MEQAARFLWVGQPGHGSASRHHAYPAWCVGRSKPVKNGSAIGSTSTNGLNPDPQIDIIQGNEWVSPPHHLPSGSGCAKDQEEPHGDEPDFDLATAHEHFSVACFNQVWGLIDKPNRTPAEDQEMVELCLASLWHWSQRDDCTPTNLSIGYWQASRVYALLGQAENAMQYARLCLISAMKATCCLFIWDMPMKPWRGPLPRQRCRQRWPII